MSKRPLSPASLKVLTVVHQKGCDGRILYGHLRLMTGVPGKPGANVATIRGLTISGKLHRHGDSISITADGIRALKGKLVSP